VIGIEISLNPGKRKLAVVSIENKAAHKCASSGLGIESAAQMQGVNEHTRAYAAASTLPGYFWQVCQLLREEAAGRTHAADERIESSELGPVAFFSGCQTQCQ
jgi:hypothetical protein